MIEKKKYPGISDEAGCNLRRTMRRGERLRIYLIRDTGFNIVLHGRDARKLESLKLEIIHHFEQNFHRSGEELQIRALVLDVYKASAEEIKREVDNVLKPLHVTILINNIGTGLRPSGVVYSTFDRDEMADIEGYVVFFSFLSLILASLF